MELERTREARDELKSRLHGISAKRWWSCPRMMFLHAKCEIECKHVEKFALLMRPADGDVNSVCINTCLNLNSNATATSAHSAAQSPDELPL